MIWVGLTSSLQILSRRCCGQVDVGIGILRGWVGVEVRIYKG